jgi:hypothetical protein
MQCILEFHCSAPDQFYQDLIRETIHPLQDESTEVDTDRNVGAGALVIAEQSGEPALIDIRVDNLPNHPGSGLFHRRPCLAASGKVTVIKRHLMILCFAKALVRKRVDKLQSILAEV